ncbi:hypothetical protein BGW80DRAFT_361931 [Lactifluus volemus]|nr:hypothetical protein BGW80DRAFT_361931 [Lactifluus volemus]
MSKHLSRAGGLRDLNYEKKGLLSAGFNGNPPLPPSDKRPAVEQPDLTPLDLRPLENGRKCFCVEETVTVFVCGYAIMRCSQWGGEEVPKKKNPPTTQSILLSTRPHAQSVKAHGTPWDGLFYFFRFYLFVPDTETGTMISGWLVVVEIMHRCAGARRARASF